MDAQLTLSDANLSTVLQAIEEDPGLEESTRHQYRKAVMGYVLRSLGRSQELGRKGREGSEAVPHLP